MNTTMAEGARERLVAQIGEALFGQPGLTLMELAEKVKGMRDAQGDVRAEFEAWARATDRSTARFNDGGYCDERTVSAWLAWIAAQPSPAGQGDALMDTARRNIRQFISKASFSSSVDKQAALSCVDVLEEAIAARLPVGAAVKDSLTVGGGQTVGQEPIGRVFSIDGILGIEWQDGMVPPAGALLYTAPPAQAVDLGQFADQIAKNWDGCSIGPAIRAEAKKLIDSKAVGNG